MKDKLGQTFGRLTVIARDESKTRGQARWICRCTCGTELSVLSSHLSVESSPSCGCWRREQSRLAHFKGGRNKTTQGYMRLFRPNHPNAGRKGYVPEHVFIMSEHLGRPLFPGETVHHRNGQRDDNRLHNLELWTSRHPSGQRTQDKIVFAKEILLRYCTFDELADWLASQEEKTA